MKFGLGQFTLQLPPWDGRRFPQLYDDLLRLAVRAEELGFDSIWFAEHHGASDGYIPSLLPLLAAIAARTEKIELGTAVMLAPFHDPVRLAEDAAAVDLLSKGRLNLGLGLGWVKHEYEMFGVDSKGRGERLSELVEFLRLAWTRDRFDFPGAHIAKHDISVTPRPERPIPIWLGGNEGRALARAARLADGHFPPSTSTPQAGVDRAREILELRASLGASGPYRYGMFLPIGIGADAEDGWAAIRDGLLHVRGAYALWFGGERDVSGARDFAASSFEDPTRAATVCGGPDEIAGALRPAVSEISSMGFADAFVSAILVTVGMPLDVAMTKLELYAKGVISQLRD